MLDSTPHQDHIANFWSLETAGRNARQAPAGSVHDNFRPLGRSQPAPSIRSRRISERTKAGRTSSDIASEPAYGLWASLLDGTAIVLASVLSGAGFRLWSPESPVDLSVFAGGGILAALLFCGILRSRTVQTPFGPSRAGRRARDGVASWIMAFGLFLLIIVAMKVSGLPRGGILVFFLVGGASIALSRVKAPFLLAKAHCQSALDGQDAIVIGPRNSSELSRLTNELRATTHHEPLPVVFDATCSDGAWPLEVKQTLRHARRLAHNAGPGKILVLGPGLPPDRLKILVAELAVLPRAICVVPDQTVTDFFSRRKTRIGDHIAVEVRPAPLNATQRAFKRVLDISMAGFLLVTLSPLFALIALLIKYDTAGPVFFRQMRTGYRGQLFKIFKFRTMTVLEDGPVVRQAQKEDRRVTRIGSILRRSSLDELPQLLNVLTGDMSLVGPRPHAVAHDKSYARQIPDYMLRQHVLPGITGWAQVNGYRGETSSIDAMHRRIEHDIWYARNCSLLLDIQIMFRTFFEVMKARNAY